MVVPKSWKKKGQGSVTTINGTYYVKLHIFIYLFIGNKIGRVLGPQEQRTLPSNRYRHYGDRGGQGMLCIWEPQGS